MRLAIKRRGLLRTAAEAAVVVILALLAMANPGSPKSPGVAPVYNGGFSSGSWDGTTSFNDGYYKFAIIDASVGSFSALCDFSTAVYPHFADAVAKVVSTPGYQPVHAFWFLMSNFRASVPVSQGGCALNLTPSQWGQRQANYFLYYVALTGYSNTVSKMLGDVEIIGSGRSCTAPDGTYLPNPDGPMWRCDTKANNEAVIKGFVDTIAASHYAGPDQNAASTGVYTSVGAWPRITDEVGASSVGAKNIWMASACASQQNLNVQAQYFADRDFYIFSWQYGLNDSSIPGCGTCELKYSDAETRAKAFPVYVPRWDVWTNSSPAVVCGV